MIPPSSPFKPGEPGEPVLPLAPSIPLAPVGPCEPLGPGSPISPLAPNKPSLPGNPMPCGPEGPGGPIGPGIPSRPGGPGGPAPRLYQFRFIFVPFANYEIGFCSNKRMSMYGMYLPLKQQSIVPASHPYLQIVTTRKSYFKPLSPLKYRIKVLTR